MCGGLLVPSTDHTYPWDLKWLFYCDEIIVDFLLDGELGERKVTSVHGLESAVEESAREGATFRIWISEGLEDAVKDHLPAHPPQSSR